MTSISYVLITLGSACLLVSGFLMYRLVPRDGAPPKSDLEETSLALGQFILLVAGIAFLVKGIF